MTLDQKEKAKRIFAYYGKKAQLLKCVEELSELSAALMKYINKKHNNHNDRLEILGEIADVEIMIEQLKIIMPSIGYVIDEKLNRQLERIANEQKNIKIQNISKHCHGCMGATFGDCEECRHMHTSDCTWR